MAAISFAALFPLSVQATLVNVDEVIFQQDVTLDSSLLTGTVDMSVSGSTLTIVLTNTSAAGAATAGSGAILTGVGFNLPTAVSIASGSVSMVGSTAVNFTAPGDNDVSGEWGYDNDPITRGPFQDPAIISSTVNTEVTSMVSSTDVPFSNTPLFNPGSLAGPEMGLISNAGDAGGQRAIRDSVTISLLLSGSFSDLVNTIDSGDVVLSFASPSAPFAPASVPEPGTVALLGLALVATGVARRRRQRK